MSLTETRAKQITAAMIAAVTMAHLIFAVRYSLNADEAVHYNMANQSGIAAAWQANQVNYHPPLLILAIHFWGRIGTAEWFLRLIPIACNAVFVWFTCRWLALIWSATAAAAAAMFLLGLPPLYDMSADLRQYTPMFAGAGLALYWHERRRPLWSALGLLMAILSNYQAAWFAVGFGCYGLIDIRRRRPDREFVQRWIAGQVTAMAAFAWLYATHIQVIRNTHLPRLVRESYLKDQYITANEDPFDFLARAISSLYQWSFGSDWGGFFGFAAAAIGVGVMIRRARWPLLALLTASFLAVMIVASAGSYPFGGARQTSLFTVWIAISAAIGVTALARDRAIALPIALAAVLAVRLAATPEDFGTPLPLRKRQHIINAVGYLQSKAPPGAIVFTDFQASQLLCYYHRPDVPCADPRNSFSFGLPGHFSEFEKPGFRILASSVWSFDQRGFVAELAEVRRRFGNQPVWFFDAGWGGPVSQFLVSGRLALRHGELKEFPGNNAVFRIDPPAAAR